jgi:P-type Cu+ transporter
MATDPICGMAVDPRDTDLSLVRDGRTYYFCSSSCLQQFAAPGRELRRTYRQLLVGWPLALLTVLLVYVWHPEGYPFLEAGLATGVQAYLGAPFYRGAYDALRTRIGNMDLLVAVATTAAWGYSLGVLLLPGRLPAALYFDASALILVLLRTGAWMEQLVRARASRAVTRLQELLPSSAHRLRDGSESEVPVSELAAGDRIRVRAGERFPVDGRILVGTSSADESLLTGEARPVVHGPGDRVIAGATNLDGPVEVEATATGEDTFLAEVGRLLTDAELAQVPLRQLADRIAAWFAPLVLALALLAAGAWAALGHTPFSLTLLVFVSVAITACPCAFGIATPAAIVVAVGRAAQEGVLFKGRDAIEKAAGADTVLFDKTGTLTAGRPRVVGLRPVEGRTEPELLGLAAGLEVGSAHPLAAAVCAAAAERGIAPVPVAALRVDPGRGVSGTEAGAPVSLRRIESGAAPSELTDAALAAQVEEWARQGRTISLLSWGGSTVGAIAFEDSLAPGAAEAIQRLTASGLDVEMVTGDSAAAASAVAERLGIRQIKAGCTPKDKLERIRELQRQGRAVAFAGDGINDAPALAAADVGIAVGAGLDVAKEAGKVVLVGADLAGVPTAIGLARATVRKVRQNLYWAIGYNLVLLPVAAGALVPVFGLGLFLLLPILGALAMGFSSALVVTNSLSLRRARLPLAGSPPVVPPLPRNAAVAG